jgi:hypothetical protein
MTSRTGTGTATTHMRKAGTPIVPRLTNATRRCRQQAGAQESGFETNGNPSESIAAEQSSASEWTGGAAVTLCADQPAGELMP